MRRAVQTEIFEIYMYKYYWATKIQPDRQWLLFAK